MKRRGSEKVRYGVNEGSCWYSLQPDKAEIWDLHNRRAGQREGAERKKHKFEKEGENVHGGERRQNTQAQGKANMEDSVAEEGNMDTDTDMKDEV